ncbi:MAG TPA: hypothetical protein VM123_17540 [archaeon]|nr:hypothetical protein [archaeon]
MAGNGTLRQHTEIPRSEKHAYTVAVNDTLVVIESVTMEVKNAGR